MLARLWWKEWRTLLSILAILCGAAVSLQWFLLSYGGRDVRHGILVPIALSWAVIYALAAGAASFAGERENRTLGLLDALPVGRGLLWISKASFVLLSSLLLGLILRGVGSVGWSDTGNPPLAPSWVDPFFGVLIFEATIWGLFWSAVMRQAITAGILAVLSTGFMSSCTGWLQRLDDPERTVFGLDGLSLGLRFGAMLLALGLSWVIMNQGAWPKFWAKPAPPRLPALGPLRLNFLTRLWRSLAPSPAYWTIAWQTWREGRITWLQTLGLGLIAALNPTRDASGVAILLLGLGLLIQGTSVFGLESSTGTRAFLNHQGIRPSTVWAGKVTPWAVGLVFIFAFLGLAVLMNLGSFVVWTESQVRMGGMPLDAALAVFLLLTNLYVMAMLGGMVLPRRITATLVSTIVGLVVIIPQGALMGHRMIAAPGLLLSPLILLAASWFWAGDWLLNRGLRRWIKLAGLVIVPYVALAAFYMGQRAWQIPDIGPQFGAADEATTPSSAGTIYQTVIDELAESQKSTSAAATNLASPSADQPPTTESLDRVAQVLTRLRATAAEGQPVVTTNAPRKGFQQSPFNQAEFVRSTLVPFLVQTSQQRVPHDLLAGAWDAIFPIFQMSNQFAAGARSPADYQSSLWIGGDGVQAAIAWAKDATISVELLQAARTQLRALGGPPDPVRVLQAEALRVERSLDEPAETWANLVAGGVDWPAWRQLQTAWIIAPPWELERTRRIMRHVEAVAIRNANPVASPDWTAIQAGQVAIPGVRAAGATVPFDQLPPDALLVGPLLKPFDQILNQYEYERAQRELLDAFLALRTWQITHDGFAPSSLNQLNERLGEPGGPIDSRLGLGYVQVMGSSTDPDASRREAELPAGQDGSATAYRVFKRQIPQYSGLSRIVAEQLNLFGFNLPNDPPSKASLPPPARE